MPIEEQKMFIRLADREVSFNKRLNELKDKNSEEKIKIQREIEQTDKEIDELVYKIYEITEEEKKVIEDFFSKT